MISSSSCPLILIRHSYPQIIPDISPDKWHLSETGRSRCYSLAERLAIYKPGVIISSNEQKATVTAQIIADQLDTSYKIADGLNEHKRNNAPFSNRQQFEAEIAGLFNQPNHLVFGEETADQAYLRFSIALKKQIEAYLSLTLLVVTHGTAISLWIARTFGLSPFRFWKRLGLPAYVVISKPELTLISVFESI